MHVQFGHNRVWLAELGLGLPKPGNSGGQKIGDESTPLSTCLSETMQKCIAHDFLCLLCLLFLLNKLAG